MVVEGIEVCRRPEAGVQVSCGDSRCHPLVIGEKGEQRLPPRFRVVPVGPVRVHKLDGLPEDVFALWVAVEVINEAGHGVVKVISLYAVVVVHDELYELKALTLVNSQHDIVVEELPLKKNRWCRWLLKRTNSRKLLQIAFFLTNTLLHKYLGVIRYNVSINNRPKGDVVAGWLDVLIHQLLVMFSLKA